MVDFTDFTNGLGIAAPSATSDLSEFGQSVPGSDPLTDTFTKFARDLAEIADGLAVTSGVLDELNEIFPGLDRKTIESIATDHLNERFGIQQLGEDLQPFPRSC